MTLFSSIATSKNLTILGILLIVQALAFAGTAVFDGNPATNVDFVALIKDIGIGIGMIVAKGAASTGVATGPLT
jgi:hypothetical protein